MSVEKTLQERGNRYGDFSVHAMIAQNLQRTMHNSPSWGKLTDVQKQALTVIADKIARILSGDPDYEDNWHDIQGYAKLVEDRLGARPVVRAEPMPSSNADYSSRAMQGTNEQAVTPHNVAMKQSRQVGRGDPF